MRYKEPASSGACSAEDLWMHVFSLVSFWKVLLCSLQVMWVDEVLIAPTQMFWLGVPAQSQSCWNWRRGVHMEWEEYALGDECFHLYLPMAKDPGKLFSSASVNHSDCSQRKTEVSLNLFFLKRPNKLPCFFNILAFLFVLVALFWFKYFLWSWLTVSVHSLPKEALPVSSTETQIFVPAGKSSRYIQG